MSTTALNEHPPQAAQTPHPAPEFVRWISQAMPDACLPGASLKYLAARLPVARVMLPAETFARWIELARQGVQTVPHVRRAALSGEGASVETVREIKLVLDLPESADEFHCVCAPAGQTSARAVFSIERLTYDWQAGEWLGSEADRDDLRARRLRCVAPPARLDAAFALKAIVLAAQLDFDVSDEFLFELARAFDRADAEKLGRKFLQKQFKKIVCGAKPSRGFLYLDRAGMLEWFLPELAAGRGLAQNRYHAHDIFLHSIYACDAVDGPDLVLRLSALFHDLGKVDTRRELPNGEATFHNHEVVSTRHTDRILRRFGFPPETIQHVRFLVRNHMFHYTGEWTDRAVRRFMNKVEPAMLQNLISLRLADRKGSGKRQALPRAIKDLIRHIARVRAEESELKIRHLAVDGHTLMEFGLRPGPVMGEILRRLLEQVKAGELVNEEEPLRVRARELVAEIGGGQEG